MTTPKLGQYVRDHLGRLGRVYGIHYGCTQDAEWLAQQAHLTDEEKTASGDWLDVLVHNSGAVHIPATKAEVIPPFNFKHFSQDMYFADDEPAPTAMTVGELRASNHPAWAIAVKSAKVALESEAKKNAAGRAMDGATLSEREDASDLFHHALMNYRADMNTLWGAASVLAALTGDESTAICDLLREDARSLVAQQ